MRARAGSTIVIGILLATFAAPTSRAFAQDPPAVQSRGLVAPRLTQGATPEYPESKKAAAEKATVTLALTIVADGSVESATVTASAGSEFDDAALAAAKKLVFAPATRDGVAIQARIPFTFDFAYEAPPPAPVVVAPAADVVVLEGTIRTPSNEPVPGATVTAAAADGSVVTTTTDASGAFRFKGLAAGSYEVKATADGFEPFASREQVVSGEVATVTYRPKVIVAAAPDSPQEIKVVGERPAREVTRRVLDRREITRIPGTNGDALRAIENMPGVARAPGIGGLLIVRGSAPSDTGIFVDGTQIPIAFHFGGLNSVVPSEVLERIDFLPGNFGPEYGRAMGGNIDIGLRSPRKDRIHGLAQVDIIDARLVFEAPLGEKTRMMVAGRRSHVDAWIGGVLEKTGAVGVRTAPVYYDYQAMLEHDLTSTTTARLSLFGSDDALRLTLNSAGKDPAMAGNFDTATRFYRVQLRTDTRFSDRTRWINTLSFGRDLEKTSVGGNFSVRVATNPVALRSDLRSKLGDAVTAVVGLDTQWTAADAIVNAAPIPEDGQDAGPYFGRQRNLQTLSTSLFRPAGYAMLEVSPVKALKLLPSVRADYSSDIREWTLSPRFATRYDVASGFPRTTLKGGVGLYHQPPKPYESLAPFGTSNLKSNRALHTSAGVEQEITRQVEVSVEGFYKKLDDLVDQRPDAANQQAGVTYTNTGSGRIYGGELLLRYKPDDRFFGWVAYTISRSERRADDSEALRPFDYDQTHVLTALGSYKLGRGWEVGARWRYVTGNPNTPVASAIFDADAGGYAPVNGAPFSARDAAFHRLDVRVDKTWTFQDWKLGAYLDVQNAYFRENPEGRSYNYNYARSGAVTGLPFLPVIGLRGEL